MDREIVHTKISQYDRATRVMVKGGDQHVLPYYEVERVDDKQPLLVITFEAQDHPDPQNVSMKALLLIVKHRLDTLQNRDTRCRDYALAVTKVQEAIHWLQEHDATGV